MLLYFSDLFRLCPPSLVSAYYLRSPDAGAIFLYTDALCSGTCSVTGGSITYSGAQAEKILFFIYVCLVAQLARFENEKLQRQFSSLRQAAKSGLQLLFWN